MRKLQIDLRLSHQTVTDLSEGKSVVIEDEKDRFVLIPPQEHDCNCGVRLDEEDKDEDDFELAEKMQKLVEMLVELQNRPSA